METENVFEGVVEIVKNKSTATSHKFVLRMAGDERWFDGFGTIGAGEIVPGTRLRFSFREVCPEGYERPFYNIVDGHDGITIIGATPQPAVSKPVFPKPIQSRPTPTPFESAKAYDDTRESIQMQVCLKVACDILVARIGAAAELKDKFALEWGSAVEVGSLTKAIYFEVFGK